MEDQETSGETEEYMTGCSRKRYKAVYGSEELMGNDTKQTAVERTTT